MIHRMVSHNGRVMPVEQTRFSPGQGGLLTGWGLFTTLRVVEGIPFAFERHWQRLHRDAERTHCPFPFDEATVHQQMHELLRANQVREGAARIYMIFNNSGFWRSGERFPDVDLLLTSAGLPTYREPSRLAVREHGRHAASPLAGVKTTAWLNNVWCLYEAQQAGYDEVVLLNERGEVAECTAANIFCAREGKVFTPPLASGCLEGVTRGILLETGAQTGVTAEERTLRPEDLYSADEVFLSSTNRNLLAVGEVAGHRIASPPGPVMTKLDKAFDVYVRKYLDAHSAAAGR